MAGLVLPLLLVVLAFGIYLLSLWLNPFVTCPLCKGRARHQGWMFSYAHHPCRLCGGTGRRERAGHALFFRPRK